jgi:hypothetical protein
LATADPLESFFAVDAAHEPARLIRLKALANDALP